MKYIVTTEVYIEVEAEDEEQAVDLAEMEMHPWDCDKSGYYEVEEKII